MKKLLLIMCSFLLSSVPVFSADVTVEAENMTIGGPYAGPIATPFNGIALYANNDNGSTVVNFPNVPGNYLIEIRGASNNTSAAGVTLQIDGQDVSTFSFTGTAATTLSEEISITGTAGDRTVTLMLTTDNGSNDTYIDWIAFTYLGQIPPPPPAPVLPAQGAFYTGVYRNMFLEAGYTQAQVDEKLNSVFEQLFYGDNDTERIYYPKGADEAYILDVDNNDIRSEGQSYGMMIAVEMNKQEEFDRMWKFAKTHMQHADGNRKGYFRWIVDANGGELDPNAAPDGEIYFATALYFASVRFGDRDGIFNYRAEADYILEHMLNKGWPHDQITGSVPNMFNPEKKVCFVPYAMSSTHTDPSYFLPSFYEVWAIMANTNNQYWSEAAEVARDFFQDAAHPVTGLMPDYSNYDGTPTGGHKVDFVVDAYRCILNVAMDYSWFKKDEREKELVMRMQSFFHSEGIYDYWSGYRLNGDPIPGTDYQAVSLVSCNAVGSLASDSVIAWEFIDALWNREPTTGRYRYYDGLLQMMSLLHLSGDFRVYTDNMVTGTKNSTNYEALSVLDVYPNPSTGNISVELRGNEAAKNITLLDLAGKVIFTSTSLADNQIQVEGLKKGVYILNVSTNDHTYSKKILVE